MFLAPLCWYQQSYSVHMGQGCGGIIPQNFRHAINVSGTTMLVPPELFCVAGWGGGGGRGGGIPTCAGMFGMNIQLPVVLICGGGRGGGNKKSGCNQVDKKKFFRVVYLRSLWL